LTRWRTRPRREVADRDREFARPERSSPTRYEANYGRGQSRASRLHTRISVNALDMDEKAHVRSAPSRMQTDRRRVGDKGQISDAPGNAPASRHPREFSSARRRLVTRGSCTKRKLIITKTRRAGHSRRALGLWRDIGRLNCIGGRVCRSAFEPEC